MARWCELCANDSGYEDKEPRCEIIVRSMMFNLGDPEYPVEWIWRDNKPMCTAFKPMPTPICWKCRCKGNQSCGHRPPQWALDSGRGCALSGWMECPCCEDKAKAEGDR
jgi:hypothetical protein